MNGVRVKWVGWFRAGSSGRILWNFNVDFLLYPIKGKYFPTTLVTLSFWVWALLQVTVEDRTLILTLFLYVVLACREEAASMSCVTLCEQLLISRTREEKTVWLDALCKAIEELCKRKSSFKLRNGCSIPADMLKPPPYIKMDSIHKCMDCSANFGVMKRKHHCRSCGMVSEKNAMY